MVDTDISASVLLMLNPKRMPPLTCMEDMEDTEDMDMEDMLVDTPPSDMVLDTPPDMVLDTPPLDMVLDTPPTDMDSDMDVVSMEVTADTLASVPLMPNPKLMPLLTCMEDMEDILDTLLLDMEGMDMEDMLVDTPPSDMVLDTPPLDMVVDTPPTDMGMDVVSMDGDVKCFASQCSSKSFHPETANSTYKSN